MGNIGPRRILYCVRLRVQLQLFERQYSLKLDVYYDDVIIQSNSVLVQILEFGTLTFSYNLREIVYLYCYTIYIYLLATRTIANLSRCKVHFRRDTQLFPDANGRKHLMLRRKGLNVRLFPTLHKSKVIEPVVPFLPHFRKLFIYCWTCFSSWICMK